MSGFGLLDILIICLYFLIIWGISPAKNSTASNYLAKDRMFAIRGFAVLIPVFDHIYNSLANGGRISYYLSEFAEFTPCMFFVISGYGLMKQNLLKDDYSKGFLLKRFPKVLVPYIMATLAFVAANFVFNGFLYGPGDIIHAILCGDPIVKFSWYVIHILLFYLWFFILMKICGKRKGLLIAGGVVYYVVTTIVFMKLGFGMHWWGTTFGLVEGMIFAVYENQIYDFFHKKYGIKIVGVLLALIVVLLCEPHIINATGLGNYFPQHAVFDLLLCASMFILLVGAKIGNPVTRFLGKYSYEIYLLQGLFILAGRSDKMLLSENVFIVFVLVGSIVSGIVLYYIDDFILNKICKKIPKLIS